MTHTIPKSIAARQPEPEQRIPRILHQTFKTADVPDAMHSAAMSWSGLNPGYEYRFYDDADHLPFLRSHFDKRVADAYGKLTEGAFRADLWRYCVLYEHGGVYTDIDSVCKTPLDQIIGTDDEFIVPAEAGTGGPPHSVFNAFICSTPGHPFLARTIEYATEMIHRSWRFDGFSMVGPGALGAGINLALGRGAKASHLAGDHAQGPIRYRILEKRAAQGDVPPLIVDGDRVLVQTRYDGYFSDLRASSVTHWLTSKAAPGLGERILNRYVKSRVIRRLRRQGRSPLQYP